MTKRINFPVIGSIILLLMIVALSAYYYGRPNSTTNTNTPITYTTVTDNELMILHLNATATAEKVGVQLTLTNHEKTEDGVTTMATVQDLSGNALGTIQFTAINETQTIGDYRFKLVSATQSAVQILALATAAE